MLFKDKYIDAPFPFPEHDVDPLVKLQEDWNRSWIKAVYSRYVQDQTGYTTADREKFDELRAYGQGRQSIEKYKTHFQPKQKPGEKTAKSLININHEIFSPAPKFKAYLRQRIAALRKIPNVIAIDEKSGLEKEEKKWRTWFYATQGEWVNKLDEKIGYKGDRPDFIPSTLEELEMFSEVNGFKSKTEIAYNMAIKYAHLLSRYDRISDKMIDDIADINMCVCKDYTDLNDGKVKTKYINPARYVGLYSLDQGFDNSPYHGHFEDYTIVQLRALGFNESELKTLAEQYGGKYGNPEYKVDQRYDVQYDNNKWSYDNFNVRVFEGEYLTVNINPKVKYTNKRGEVRYERDGEIRNNNSNGRSEMTYEEVRCWYRCKWIVGSDLVFDYGMQYDVPRPTKNDPKASYHPFKIPGKSFMETSIISLDQIQLAHIKMENALAKAPPDGLAIDYGSLENINLGKGTLKPIELLRIRRTQGDFIYRATTHRGHFGGSSPKPVIPLPGGAGKMLEEAVRMMELHFHLMAENTGIDRNSIGVTPSPETSATASAQAAMGSSVIIEDMANAINNVNEELCVNLVHRTALIVKYSKKAYNMYHPALGNNVEILKISADMTPDQMGIEMKVVPNDQAIRDIHESAMAAMKEKESGGPGIEMPDYLMVKRLINEGHLDYAQAMLNYKQQRAKKVWEKSKNDAIDRQNEGLNRIKQTEIEGKAALEDAKHQRAIEILDKTLENEKSLVTHTEEQKRVTLEMELEIKGKQEVVSTVMNQPPQEQLPIAV